MAVGTRTAAAVRLAPSWLGTLAWALYLASLMVATLHVASAPAWNLDGVFYSALMHPEVDSSAELHRSVYAQIEQQVPKASATDLLSGSKYRRQLRASADAFAFQLPFYVGKPLYCWLGRCLTAAGVSSLRAPSAVSAVCFCLIGMLLPLLAIRAGARPVAAAGVAALSVWLPQLRELGALATPDALATALIVAGAVLCLSSVRVASLAMAAAVLARPDAAFLAIGVLGAAWLREPTRSRAREVLALCAAIGLLAALVLPLSGGYGWATVMRQTFIKRVVSQEELHAGLSVAEYFRALGRGLAGHMTDHVARFVPYLGLAALGLWAYVRRGRNESSHAAALLLIAIWAATLVRFFALPILADRFFAPAYVCTLALACALATCEPSRPELSRLHVDA